MAHSKSTSTPTKKTSKTLKVRKSKSSKATKVSTSKTSDATVSKRKSSGKGKVVDEGCTGGLKLLKRNPVTMPRMTTGRILKKRLTVEFDKDGTPIGKNGDALQSYIGVLARSKIPISIESWTDKIIATEKNNIWETILVCLLTFIYQRNWELCIHKSQPH
jgi:hypothetical protein